MAERDEIDDFRNGILYEVRQGDLWDAAQFIRSQAHPPFIAQGNGTFLIKARCQPVAGLPSPTKPNSFALLCGTAS